MCAPPTLVRPSFHPMAGRGGLLNYGSLFPFLGVLQRLPHQRSGSKQVVHPEISPREPHTAPLARSLFVMCTTDAHIYIWLYKDTIFLWRFVIQKKANTTHNRKLRPCIAYFKLHAIKYTHTPNYRWLNISEECFQNCLLRFRKY